jgi:hypothetical protein
MVGPGHYNPNVKQIKKEAKACSWGISKSKRSVTTIPQSRGNPGPGAYSSEFQSMAEKATATVREDESTKASNFTHYKALQARMNMERFNHKKK